jgi:hypothetical protein
MAKHRFQASQIQLMRHLLLAALVLGWGVSVRAAEPQTGNSPAQGGPTGQSRAGRSAKVSGRHANSASVTTTSVTLGKRDPFKLPEVATGKGGAGGEGGVGEIRPGEVLPPGKRGLLISQLMVEGIVRQQTTNKMTALVVDQRRLAYFLHENDSVYNGVVSKITPDAVYFTENVLDPKGRVTAREVVKRLGSAPGEGR